ncbi:ubiquinone biosynthesis hydroxylase, UbiH/UbiF/VisC/COQ6 family [Sphingobacterium multivorum]|uniref:Ubiquinone biosynthesis hydroxylase, UbiH/UbiF/VisC/COQ6 family n=1 Tax=Sphingobacterium multivorum TaxID=28454 RepID=A0A2X2L8J6_SPHMU|nr:FAD-dependent monooxygenase [Sphingobacterium multivorum]SPZ85560.1 ubiquinone biosynthesis hydroxylase, UbiH/UbiF/VisC/COQ6 family [Sphingobacterium multivorum]
MQESGIDFNNKQQVFDWFKVAFSSWSEQWHELFASNEIWFMPRPQYYFPLDETWPTLPNLTMLGDAAHRIPPYAGEGVNQAMQDAFELAENLTSDHFPDIQTAISQYENKCRQGRPKLPKIRWKTPKYYTRKVDLTICWRCLTSGGKPRSAISWAKTTINPIPTLFRSILYDRFCCTLL